LIEDIIAASYAAAALVYLFFFLLLLTDRQRGRYHWLLLGVALVGIVWAAHLWLAASSSYALYLDSFIFDGLRGWVWALFFSAVISGDPTLLSTFRANPVVPTAGGLLVVLIALRLLGVETLGVSHTQWLLIYDLFISCLVLLLVERCYRLTEPSMRQAIRPLCLALGILYLFDLYMFSQAMLFGYVESMVWRLRGFGHLLAVPFFLLTTKRSTGWAIRIFVSRTVIYNSSLLLFVGLYLLLMSLAGYYVRYIGGEWGSMMRLAFILLAMALLLVIFLSEPFRQQFKVLIAKHFFANKYEYRDEWLAVTQALSRQRDCSAYQQALGVITERLEASQAALYSFKNGSFVLMSQQGDILPIEAGLDRLLPFWTQRPWVVDLDEFRLHPERYEGLVVDTSLLSQSDIRILLPLYHSGGLFGAISLGPSNLKRLNFEDRDYLKTIADQLVNFLVLSEANKDLAEAKQFETFNQMSAFLVHDLKNTLAQLQMILVNAQRHKHNPEFIDDSLDTLGNVVKRLQRTMDHLRRDRPMTAPSQRVSLSHLSQEIIRERSVEKPLPMAGEILDLNIHIDAARLKSVLSHLVQNAQEATDDDGEVRLNMTQTGDSLVISVVDTGQGMDESFVRERLFRPFDTTKGNGGMGIGVYEARQFAEQVQGRLDVTSKLGEGTTFVLTLPLLLSESLQG
jgi:putative PEP-CTERM system histidine kinase